MTPTRIFARSTECQQTTFVAVDSRGKKLQDNNRANAVMNHSYSRGGLGGDVMLGAALGPTFSSCSPTYAVIVATVLPVSFAEGLLYIVVYAVGLASALYMRAATLWRPEP